jgi:hypothetical protein
MLRKGLVLAALCLLPAAAASAQVHGPWEVTLSGTGASPSRFNGFEAGANGSIGYFFNDSLEASIRQSINYTDIGGPVAFNGSTRLAGDIHLPLGDQNQFLPFIGANIGYDYGKGLSDTWEAAPEAGIKVFVSNDVFLFGEVEYQFFFRNGGGVNNGFKNGEFVYSLGVGFRF